MSNRSYQSKLIDQEMERSAVPRQHNKNRRSIKNWFLGIFRIKRSKAPYRSTVDSQKDVDLASSSTGSSSQSITIEENTEDAVIECNVQDVLSEQDDHESQTEANGISINHTSFDKRYISPHDNTDPYLVSHHPSYYVDDKTMDMLHNYIQHTNNHCFRTSTGYCRMQTNNSKLEIRLVYIYVYNYITRIIIKFHTQSCY